LARQEEAKGRDIVALNESNQSIGDKKQRTTERDLRKEEQKARGNKVPTKLVQDEGKGGNAKELEGQLALNTIRVSREERCPTGLKMLRKG